MLILKEDYEISRMTNSKFYKSFNLMNTSEHLFYTRQDLYFLTIPGLFFPFMGFSQTDWTSEIVAVCQMIFLVNQMFNLHAFP